jgi:Dullard-like phosphatase family protein
MSDLVIKKVNESYIKVDCEKHIAKELSEYFQFYVPGYQFVPAFRNRIWDGKVRLYNLQTSQIYYGLLSYIELFSKERNYTYEYQDGVDTEDEYSKYHAEKFIKELDIHGRGEPIEVREHQIAAYIHAMQKKRALLVSPTASGKSLIIYLIFRQLYKYQNLKGLVIVPTTSLVEQLYSDFADYNNDSMEPFLHRIYQGKEKTTDKPLTISTWQSLYKMPKEYFEQFDYIIGDEAHLFKAQSLTSILTSCVNAKYRFGLTGTLDGTKTHKLVLEGLFGSVEKVISTKELIDKQQLSNFEILVFTASMKEYADSVLNMLDPENKFFKHRFYRNNCICVKNRVYIKDLRIFANRKPENIIMVDNSMYSFTNQISNGVLINSFYNDKEDKELFNLLNYLLNYLQNMPDVRSVNDKVFNFNSIIDDLIKSLVDCY